MITYNAMVLMISDKNVVYLQPYFQVAIFCFRKRLNIKVNIWFSSINTKF